MEYVFIGPVPLPITPAKIEVSKPGGNETVRLINDGEINILHSPGLKSFTFDVILPTSYSYPFQNYPLGGMEAEMFTIYFDLLHKRKLPFPFIQVTWGNSLAANIVGVLNIAFSNTLCTIEEMTDLRDADNGQDKIISLSLKEFKDYGTRLVKESGKDSDGNVTYKVTEQTSKYNPIAELNKLLGEIGGKFNAIGSSVNNALNVNGTASNPAEQTKKTDKFLGW